jgi:hypothetical protein
MSSVLLEEIVLMKMMYLYLTEEGIGSERVADAGDFEMQMEDLAMNHRRVSDFPS